MVHHDGDHVAHSNFNKVLAKADTVTAKERARSKRAADSAIRALEVGRRHIKALRDKFIGLLPRLGLVANRVQVQLPGSAFLNDEAVAQLHISNHDVFEREESGRLHS